MIVLLIDIRHKVSENDKMMYEYIKSTTKPYLIIANKADKIAITKVLEIRKELDLDEGEILLPFSAERRIYSSKVWENINIRKE